MIKRTAVWVTGILLLASSLSAALPTTPAAKREYTRQVAAAKQAWQSGQPVTREQKALLKEAGVTPDIHRPLHNPSDLDEAGGPDGFGYFYIDSQEDGGPAYDWVPSDDSNDDVDMGPFDIGFDFPYYGQTYTQFWVCSNGFVTFQDPQGAAPFSNLPFPVTYPQVASIFPLWDDMVVHDGGQVTYATMGDCRRMAAFSCSTTISPVAGT